ncbi:uncharacterized protein CDAR_260761 [Caerostris darwini]|uniref:RNase H type-1 domain-containing protein n=1 Tax=Caerostris darwini TaxID=1538125 RepID=A0AAV4WT46_9ARAC|nr:uncharacterized protein CDAR_260761 [Caerostris darwini]
MQTYPLSSFPLVKKEIYKRVIEKIIFYGFEVRFTDTAKQATHLNKLQRLGLLNITKYYRTVSTEALQVLAGVPPIILTLRNLMKIFRLRTLGEDIQIGNRNLRAEDLEVNNSILAPWEKLKFGWRYLQPQEGGYCIFTDGSKKDGRVGCAMVIFNEGRQILQQNWRLNDEASVFMAELHDIKMAISHIRDLSLKKAKIITDSRSVLQALNNPSNTNPSVLGLKELLRYTPSVEFIWTRAHIGVAGNESADFQAKLGTERPIIDFSYSMPLSLLKSLLLTENLGTWQQLWSTSLKGRDVFQLCPMVNLRRIHGNFFINQGITGSWNIAKHQTRFFGANPDCSCGTANEDREHIIFHCPQWAEIRKEFFPRNFVRLSLLGILSNERARTGVEAIMKKKLETIFETIQA